MTGRYRFLETFGAIKFEAAIEIIFRRFRFGRIGSLSFDLLQESARHRFVWTECQRAANECFRVLRLRM